MSPDDFGDQFKMETCSSGSVLLLSGEIICLLGPTNICNLEVSEELDLSESSEKLSIWLDFNAFIIVRT